MSFRSTLVRPRIAQAMALLLSLAASAADAKVKYVSPVADAQVASGATVAGTNYGSATSFFVQSANTANTFGDERGWLKFDLARQLPAGATITRATLRLYNFDTDPQGDNLDIEVRAGISDGWQESTITWTNQPGLGATAFGPVTLSGADEFRWYEVDVTSLVSGEWAGDKLVSVAVKPVAEGSSTWRTFRFNSREFGTTLAPRLLIEYTGDWSTANAIDVIHFNDIHARILPHDYDVPEGPTDTPELESIGGAAYLASRIIELKQARPDALVLGGGDYSEGSPIGDLGGNRGIIGIYQVLDAELKALGGRGLDAEVVGNHDVRKRSMLTHVRNSGLPFLSMNLLCGLDPSGKADPTCPNVAAAEAGQPVQYFNPYRVITVAGKRIGILGYSSDDSSHLSTVAEVGAAEATEHVLRVAEVRWEPSSFRTDPANTVYMKDMVSRLRRPVAAGGEGVDVVILLAHVGHRRLNATDDILLGSNDAVAPPDLVVAGHWHTTTGTVWQPSNLNYDTVVAEAASYAQYVGEVKLSADGNYLSSVKHPIRTAAIMPNPAVEARIAALRAEYDASAGVCILDPIGPTNVHPCDVDRVVGYSAVDLRLDKDKWFTHSEFPWSGDNTAGQWVADGMAWKGAANTAPGSLGVLAIQSGGGIRRDVKAGYITYGEIYETYPWQDDEMVRVELTGQQIRDYLQSKFVGASISRDWLVTADDGQVSSVTFQGTPISLTGIYTVFISEYMYRHEDWISESGSDVTFAAADPTPTFLGLRIRDAVVEYTAQFPGPGMPLTVPGPRYALNTEFAGTFRAVVTMVNDAENQPYFEALFVRLLDALPETLARRTGYGLANIVQPNGTINPQSQWRETMLYRSHLGFPDGVLKVGDIITIKGEGGFFSGNPQFVDQEGIYADATEFERHGRDASLALPEFHPSFDTFWDEFHENHLVRVRATRVSNTEVRDAAGNTYPIFKEGGFYRVVRLPGSNGEQLELTGVQTQRNAERRFRLREVTALGANANFPPSSAVQVLNPGTVTVAPVLLTALASDLNAWAPPTGGLATWNTSSLAGNEVTANATSVAANLTALPLSRGTGLGANSGAGSFNSSGWEGTDPAANATEHVQLGFTVASGFEVDLSSFAFSGRSSSTGPRTMGVFYSGDNYTTALSTITLTGSTTPVDANVDLTALPPLTGTVTFRIREVGNVQAGNGTTATASGGTFRIQTNGAVGITFAGSVQPVGAGGTGGSGGSSGSSAGTVSSVGFYARQSSDGGSTWGGWQLVGTDHSGPAWSTSFNPTGYGLYEFYSIATDSTNSVEPAPVYADATLTFTSLPPAAPFNPSIADGATGVSGVSSIGISVSDPDSATLDVCFYRAGNPATLIACVTGVPSGGVASVAWTGLAASTTHRWYAVATDGAGVQTQSATFSFTTAAPPAAVNVPALHWLAQMALLLFVTGLGARCASQAGGRR